MDGGSEDGSALKTLQGRAQRPKQISDHRITASRMVALRRPRSSNSRCLWHGEVLEQAPFDDLKQVALRKPLLDQFALAHGHAFLPGVQREMVCTDHDGFGSARAALDVIVGTGSIPIPLETDRTEK